MLSIQDNPPETSRPFSTLEAAQYDWCVCQTKSRREKALAFYLKDNGIDYFLPLVRSTTHPRSRALSPFFQGIIFIANTIPHVPPPPAHYHTHLHPYEVPTHPVAQHQYKFHNTVSIVRQSKHVYDFLYTLHQSRLRLELRALALSATTRTNATTIQYRSGERVQVTSGPLKDLEGSILSHTPNRLFVELPMLGRVISIEMDPLNVSPITKAA